MRLDRAVMILSAVGVLAALAADAQEQTPSECPMHATHQGARDQHGRGVDERHDAVTGVSHELSTHHFLLYPDGGRIVLEAADESDTQARDLIRAHLQHVADEFANGRFDLPMLIHDRMPPGTDALQRFKGMVRYEYVPTARGGAVDITTTSAEALDAVHAFLGFQIRDHGTGDSGEVMPRQ